MCCTLYLSRDASSRPSRHRGLARFLFLVAATVAEGSSQIACMRKYSDFMPSIYEDLLPWQTRGITESHLEKMMEKVVQHEPIAGASMGVAIINNTVFVMNGDSDDTAFGAFLAAPEQKLPP